MSFNKNIVFSIILNLLILFNFIIIARLFITEAIQNKKDTVLKYNAFYINYYNLNYFLVISIVAKSFPDSPSDSIINFPSVSLLKIRVNFTFIEVESLYEVV